MLQEGKFMPDLHSIPEILKKARVIAVVGISDKSERPSYDVATYLLDHGYEIIPINPNLTEWKGIKAYPSLTQIDADQKPLIDIVDIFRKSEDVLPIVEDAIKIGAKTVWMQLGIKNEDAAKLAKKAHINVIMDKCIKIEHQKLNL